MDIDNELRKKLLNFSVGNKKDPTACIVYIYLLMYAKFKDGIINGIELKRGQCLTSFRMLSNATGITERGVRTAVKKLIAEKYIKQHSTNHYTIFTICSYDMTDRHKTKNKTDKKSPNPSYEAQNEQDIQRYNELTDVLISGQRELTAEEKDFFNNFRR